MTNRIKFLTDRKDYVVQEIQPFLQNLSKSRELGFQDGELRFGYYNSLASTSAFLDDVATAQKYYCKVAKISIEYYKIFNESRYPNLKKNSYPLFSYSNQMISAILSNNEEVLTEYAQIIEWHYTEDYKKNENYYFTYAMKYLLLHDFEKSALFLKEVHIDRYFRSSWFRGRSHIIKGILEKNDDLLNEGIAIRLKKYKRENKPDTEFGQYDLETTSYVKIALMFGASPDITNPLIHKAMLTKSAETVYEGIEDVIQALEKADKDAIAPSTNSIIDKIKNLFNSKR